MLRSWSVSGACVVGTALLAVGAGACGGAEDALDTQSASALADNSLTANSLTANSLTANSLTANSLTANALRDPLSRELLKYVVSCALDDGQSLTVTVDGLKYRFDGSLGLAPQWGGRRGSCDGSCQRWVSACVMARVDFYGVKREISIRGDNDALRPDGHELRDYPVREAAYFGNLFVEGKPRFLCLAPGQTSDQRVCGPSLTNCPMAVVGSCDDACDNGPYRSFSDCSDAGREGRGRTYAESITVFLPR